MRKKPYRVVGLGGTFDHFHAGHKAFIDFAGSMGNKLVIGVTADEIAKHKEFPDLIEPLRLRKHSVLNYCKQKHYQAELITLYDTYGTTLDPDVIFDALAVTEETIGGAKKINDTRAKLQLKELPVHSCPLVFDLDNEKHIHSVRIRSGEISRRGEVYASLFTNTIELTENQRAFFSKIQGDLVQFPSKKYSGVRLVVGDISLERFRKEKWQFDIGVYDEHSHRSKVAPEHSIAPTKSITNLPGTISPELSSALQTLIAAKKGYLHITGEEDLATVVSVLILPLGSEVYYGQPDTGLVCIRVSEGTKLAFYNALSTYVQQQ
jgi:pantetheine-phosphate adenylyltransferase